MHVSTKEADKEAQKRQSRALNGDTAKQAKPSSLMNQIEDGLSIVADFVSDGVDSYSSDDSSKRKSVAEDAADVAGTGKKHLHHILHKLGSKTAATNRSEESGVARGSDATDLDEEVEAAVEDGFVDYGFGAGQRKLSVIYYEHAQHQHHYDEGHGGGDEWNGGYWKRSLHNVHDDGPVAAASEPSYGYYAQERSEDDSGHHYRGQQHYVQQPQANNPSHYPYDPHSMAYNQQRPYA
ncbi:conserved hypothetical protein [Culex quinquefasciatus]|uniref:Uncharacterized protein n=1 Tax=Culex quinquefasciatus TaxID=7176 RepID=B0X7K4_CULQU|nr:conserved hypothetical protein [Culex quinquefasciatus]|eukprot:XP_001865626.1 conserved hypothetical protein [Culex quinquefasciatus]